MQHHQAPVSLRKSRSHRQRHETGCVFARKVGITYSQPDDNVRIRRDARAPAILLVAETSHHDWIVQRALAVGREGLHIEDVDPLHLTQDLETLETGRLLQIIRDSAGRGAGGKEVGFVLDFCSERA